MERLGKEVTRTILAFACLVCIASTMAWIQLMNDNASLATHMITMPSLLDASRSLQTWRWVKPWMADISLYTMVGGSVAGLLFGLCLRGRTLFAIQLVRRFFWLMACGYGLRALTLFGTILPPSNPACLYVKRGGWEAVRAVPQLLSGSIHTCSDKIFSGHTLVATLLAAFWFNVAPGMQMAPRVYAAGNWCLMVVCSLGGRHHYTVDIVVGAIVAALIFHLYHSFVRMVQFEDQNRDAVYLSKYLRAVIVFMDGMDLRDVSVASDTQYLPLYDKNINIKTISS